MKQITDPVEFLIDNGILFEINRQILHPLGMQLEISLDSDGRVENVDLMDNRDSEAPIYFSSEEYERGRQKYQAYMESAGRRNIQKRRRMGLVIQTGPNLPHHVGAGGEG